MTIKKTPKKSVKKAAKKAAKKIKEHTDEDGHSHFYKLVPNIMTLCALAAGLSSIQFAIDGSWEKAAIAIVFAGLFDVLDGASARLLNATSEFGAQLDSLSDFLAFGIAPSVVLYLWILEESGKIGWIAMLVFAVATAMRLARFNVSTKASPKIWAKGFFEGVPAPGGAGLALLPLFVWLIDPDYFEQFNAMNIVVGLWVLFCAGMMVSRIPTWSSKMIHVPKKMAMPALTIAGLIIAALIQAPWISLSIISIMYLGTIPFSIKHYKKLARENEQKVDLTDLALGISEED
ncbi:MAG: phosphatidylcholine/phosphatidylserine synthase [Gammaproteobacteria bacterium]|nr:phosphatidylcholine/phosphatidylserine synthase [Gammaproteobacteria bacterium]